VHEAVPGRDVTTVLRHIVEKLRLADERDRETLADVLLARGSLGVTTVGEGIAIPHVRTPIILSTTDVVISLSFLATPIDLGAADARAIDTFFFLISPTVHVHLAMLARLAHALRNDSFKAAIHGRVPAEILKAARSVEGVS
jgi:PTS system nitrogen regulatory IIA component